ncbi:tyrosine-protein phosphatase [Paenibacillus filicis]|uniref:Tyrosine-protein phosphatase n=1 Tax=Paenibacillus gyeongsangnamensis TaxID=3388067 RepID=A0ABT4QA42_9BACL|nr:tyrosine-protein phosphatase [Paenibacillus filicis]MCZ8513762.1 tyrosine-protein phosphatase [Paenibacillus filicis]
MMNSITPTPERVIKLQGAYNVRDLGGYAAADGRMTRWGQVYRADGLHKLSELDQQELIARGLAKVVDLRHDREIEEMKDVFAGSDRVAYHHVSLINPTSTANSSIRSLGDMYVGMLEQAHPSIRAVMELIAGEEQRAVLFHCTAGKDRTGVISGLLLQLAGVPDDIIIEDYAMTSECIAPLMEELRAGRPEMVPAEMYEKFLGCDRDNMSMMLGYLQEAYGGAERYLLSIGVTEAQVASLKSKLLGQ